MILWPSITSGLSPRCFTRNGTALLPSLPRKVILPRAPRADGAVAFLPGPVRPALPGAPLQRGRRPGDRLVQLAHGPIQGGLALLQQLPGGAALLEGGRCIIFAGRAIPGRRGSHQDR